MRRPFFCDAPALRPAALRPVSSLSPTYARPLRLQAGEIVEHGKGRVARFARVGHALLSVADKVEVEICAVL
jgi:hypothetical protein